MKIRSLLFVPGNKKMLSKIELLDADAYIIDLEDSIEENNKQNAIKDVLDYLDSIDFDSAKIFVRINKNRYMQEAELLERFSKLGFMLPKFEDIDDYAHGEKIWKAHDVIALVETPKGLICANETAACSWVNALAFGAEDYTAKVNMKNDFNKLIFHKSLLVTYAKTYNKAVYDTPSFQLSNQNAFEDEVENAMELGFDGKLAINPKQLAYINKQFSVGDLNIIKEIVDTYEKQKKAVLVVDGVVYEKMHIARFKRILKENKEG